jgi:chemotaxis protein MotA
MNLNYIIGVVLAIVVMLLGMITTIDFTAASPVTVAPGNLMNFFDIASVLIVIGCTFAIVAASFPGKMLLSIPKHFAIMLNTKRFNPNTYIEQLVELAQIERKNGLLSLE